MTSFLRTRILFSLALGLFVLTASSAMADVTYDSAAGTFTGYGTYSEAVDATINLTATPTNHQETDPDTGETVTIPLTFTNNIVSTGNFTQTGENLVFGAGTVNSFNSLFINNGSGNGAKMTLKGSMKLTELHIANVRTTYLDITDGATLNVSGKAWINEAKNAQGVVTQTGGTVSFTTSGATDVRIGHWPNTGYPSRYDISGGSLSIPNTMTYVGWDGYAEMNISGNATVSLKGLSLSNSGTGQGTLRLTGGTLNIGDGGIIRNNRGASGPKAAVINLGNGTINATASHSWGSDMTVTLNSGTATTFNVDADKTITMNSVLAGSGTLTKTGGGTLAITNNSSSLGKIVVNGGTVVAQNNANAINATNGVDLNAGALQISNLQNVQGSINANGGTIQSADGNNSFVGDVTLSAATTIDVADSYTFNTTGTIGSASGDTNVYQISKTGTGTWNIAGTINCGYFNPAGGTVKVISGGELNATQLVLRQANGSDTYTFTVDGGSVNITGNDHRLGHWPNHTGVVNINSGSFSAADTVSVGWDGTGKLYQTGGTATFSTLDLRNTSSLIEFSGGTTNITTLNIGVRRGGSQAAAGSVTFKGTSNVTLNYLYAYHKGTLKIQDNANVTVNNEAYFVQANNSCTFTIEQTGGTFTVNGNLALGHYYYSDVTYNISGGTLNVPNYSSSGQSGFWLAVDSNGTLNQSGGTINAGRLNLNARDDRQTGTYVMTGGTLNVGTGGIMASVTGNGRYVIKLQKGTITAGASSLTANKGNWSSNLNMQLTGTDDNRVTFKPESGYSIALSGALSGSGGMIKDGAGTLTLSGTNTYAGGTLVKAGTLAVSTANSLGSGAVTINGGTLNASAAGTSQTFNTDLVIGPNGGTVTVANSDSVYSSFNSISGSGDLTTNGTVHFGGTGGYSGHITVNSKFTRIDPGAFGVFDLTLNGTSSFNVYESGTIQIKTLNSTTASWLFGSTGTNTYNFEIGTNTTASDESSYSGFIRGSSAGAKNVTVTKVGAGKQTFNTAGKCYGIDNVYVNGGTMVIAATGSDFKAETTEGYWGNATVTVNSGGTLVYNGMWNTSPNYDLNVNGGTLTINSYEYQNKLNLNTATVNGSADSELRVGYVGSGEWNVTGGTSTIDNKIIAVKSGSYTTFTINIADGATLDIKKNISGLGGYTGTDLVVNGTGDGTGKIKFNPSSSNYASNMGTVLFNNVNVELAENTDWMDHPFFGDSSVTLKNSTMTSKAAHALNGAVVILDESALNFDGDINTYAYQITLKNGSTIGGEGSSFRTGYDWNSQFNTVYESGTTENVMNTISADIAMYDTRRTMTFNIADKAPLTVSGSFVPAEDGHYNALVKTGAGVMTITQPLETVGNVSINEGTLVLSEGGTLNNLSGGSIDQSGHTDVAAVLYAPGQSLTLSNSELSKFIGSITAQSIIKDGNGTLQIYGEAEGSIDVQSLTVSSGRLDLKGYMTGGITVDANTIFSPGNSVGEATFGGGYILNDGATLLIEQDATGMDKLTASSFEIHPNSILDLTLGSVQSGEYVILEQKNGDTPVDFGIVTIGGQTYDYSDVSFWNSLLSDDDAYYWNLSVNGNKVMASIDANAVPEPSTWALVALGVAGLMYWRKRKNA